MTSTSSEDEPRGSQAQLIAMVGLVGLSIPQAWLPATITSFGQMNAAAAIVLSFPLADDIEPAPIFEA